MARQIRIEYEGAAYHVMARGNQGQPIFADNLDRTVWRWQRTTAGRRWVSERLGMGEESGVSKAIRLVKDMRDVELNRLKRRLLQAMKDGGEKENPARE